MDIIKKSGVYLYALLLLALTMGCTVENNITTNKSSADMDASTITSITLPAPHIESLTTIPAGSSQSVALEESPETLSSIPSEQPELDDNVTFETKAMEAIRKIKAYRGPDLGIPESTNLIHQRESYTIGQFVELSYWADDFYDYYRVPFCWEINYPQIFISSEREMSASFDVNELNEMLYDTVIEMMPRKSGDGYATYDITYADDDYISICFFGKTHQGGGKPGMFVSAVTIDLKTGETLTLSDFIDVGTLTQESLVADYTVVHKDSQVVEDSRQAFIEQAFSLTDFYENIDGHDAFFLSDDSSNGIFLILRSGRHYVFVGQ